MEYFLHRNLNIMTGLISFRCLAVTVCAKTDRQWTTPADISTAELNALSCPKNLKKFKNISKLKLTEMSIEPGSFRFQVLSSTSEPWRIYIYISLNIMTGLYIQCLKGISMSICLYSKCLYLHVLIFSRSFSMHVSLGQADLNIS